MKHLEPEVLALIAGGDLPGAEAREAAAHVAECAACAAAVAEIRASLGEFRDWASETGVPNGAEIQALHESVLRRLPPARRNWMPAMAAAAAVLVACAGLAIWGPSLIHRQSHPVAIATAANGVKRNAGAGAANHQPKVLDAPARNISHGVLRQPHVRQSVIAGARNVSLKHDSDGAPMLQIATANPNVVVLWYVDEGSKKDDE